MSLQEIISQAQGTATSLHLVYDRKGLQIEKILKGIRDLLITCPGDKSILTQIHRLTNTDETALGTRAAQFVLNDRTYRCAFTIAEGIEEVTLLL